MAKNLQITVLLDFYGDMLTDKQREVVENYYNDDLSLSEIAEERDITRQGVRDAIKRSEALLVDMEERLGLAKRFKVMHDKLAYICDCALEIGDINENMGENKNEEIENAVAQIISAASELVNEEK